MLFFIGEIYNDSSVKYAAITDGTSNTFVFGARVKGHGYILDSAHAVSDNSWNSGRWNDTLFSTLYPINLATDNNASRINYTHYSATAAGGYHPGGANFAVCDGSVRLIKNSISSWSFTTGNSNSDIGPLPDNTTYMPRSANSSLH